MDDELITLADMAEILGVTYQAIANKKHKSSKFPKFVKYRNKRQMYRKADFIKWQNNEQATGLPTNLVAAFLRRKPTEYKSVQNVL